MNRTVRRARVVSAFPALVPTSESRAPRGGASRSGRPTVSRWVRLALLAAAAGAGAWAPSAAAARQVSQGPLQTRDVQAAVDSIFAAYDGEQTPGCAVGVEQNGQRALTAAYGMSNLEFGIPNTPISIFENGSVSKQFTAAAVVLLAMEGKLSLGDDVREYVPELPDYGHTVTLRHMLNHTSGLRDWGSVAGISGWGRSNRTHTHDHVVDILSRQSALNFEPGHEYSYSNSGYNLLAVVVSRVSGMPFAQFSRERIFEPLGMDDTQWRDDWTRIVPRRSTGYSPTRDGWRINQPIENVHGNGGLLTTVGDLLTWNRSLDEASLAGPEFVAMMETQGVLNDGRTIAYALGLSVDDWRGVRSVTHGGATSGYRAFLARYPDVGLSVALLCNASNANPGGLSNAVARLWLEDAFGPAPELPDAVAVDEAILARYAGFYRDEQTGTEEQVILEDGGRLRIGGTVLVPASETAFRVGTSSQMAVWEPSPDGARTGFRRMDGEIVVDMYEPVERVEPTADELREYVGTFHSDDAETTLTFTVDEGALVIHRRPADAARVRPSYRDAFFTPIGFVRFLRDDAGQVVELSLGQGRVYDMRFQRMEG
ncbi:MAG: beta-lactamase family protein [Gemmatimonadales bacterium]|nr:MAG: beta-lactamase family protein [Gemmatimonadales bacterium]